MLDLTGAAKATAAPLPPNGVYLVDVDDAGSALGRLLEQVSGGDTQNIYICLDIFQVFISFLFIFTFRKLLRLQVNTGMKVILKHSSNAINTYFNEGKFRCEKGFHIIG